MRRSLPTPLLLVALVCLAPAVRAQDPVVRPVLDGEPATILFGPNGGYAQENYLKRFTRADTGQPEWASQNGAVSELIRRCPQGGKIRIGSFKLSDAQMLDSLFAAARERNVEVKLWLKGLPGLDYVIPGHEEIANRANRYLRERAQKGKQAEWGDFQVMIGTAAQMDAYGKVNDMHEKFGIVALDPQQGPGKNNCFLGTSNLGESSDTYHNENRVLLLENPKAAQRLWEEFDRLWTFLGEGKTFVAGDPSKGTNVTPEGSTKIRGADGSSSDERPADPIKLRFTYEKRGGKFHRISDDFVAAIEEAADLEPGQEVWLAQFGFQIQKIATALIRSARKAPEVQFHVAVHMGEGDSWALKSLVEADLPNLHVGVKWDSNKLQLSAGARPRLPQPGEPAPALLHHKSLVVGDRLLITGSFNFFGDADDQGENIVMVRPEHDARYAPLLEDMSRELRALSESGVLIDARTLFGPDGLYETIQAYSKKPGFLALKDRLSGAPRTAAELRAGLPGNPTQAQVEDYLDVLTRFGFAQREADGRYHKADDPDQAAHAGQDAVRASAREPEPTPTPDPTPDPTTGGEVVLEGTVGGEGTTLDAGDVYALDSATAAGLWRFEGERARVRGVPGTEHGERTLAVSEVLSPREATLTAAVVANGDARLLVVNGASARTFGPAARLLSEAAGQTVTVRGWQFTDAAGATTAVYVQAVQATAAVGGELSYNFQPVGRRVEAGEAVWVEKLSRSGKWAFVRIDGHAGYLPARDMRLGASGGSGLLGGVESSGD